MKKALIVTTISGFVPQFCLNDVRILQDLGYEVHYASNFEHPIYKCDEQDLINRGMELHNNPIEKSPKRIFENFRAFVKLKRLIETENIDLVHVHTPMGAVIGRLAAMFAYNRPTVVYTAHGFHFYRGCPVLNWLFYYTAEKRLARHTDVLITINREDKDHAKKFRLRKNGSVEQIHGVGVDLNKFKANKEIEEDIRASIGVPKDAFHIVTAAELNDNKNQIAIIEAIAQIERNDIYYSLCGKGPNREKLEATIKERGLEDRVHLLGYRCDMQDVLQTADCFAFPSIREGLGIAAVEALATGVPIIAADNRGTREYIMDQYNGILCDPESVEDFKNAIISLVTDVNKRNKMSARCSETAEAFGKLENDSMMRLILQKADKRVEERDKNLGKCS